MVCCIGYLFVVIRIELMLPCVLYLLKSISYYNISTKCVSLFYRVLLQYMSSCSWKPMRLAGRIFFCVVSLRSHQFVEALPEGSDCLVFAGSFKNFFELSVEMITAREELLKVLYRAFSWVFSTICPTELTEAISAVRRSRSRSKKV
jgi:hypothetical protein